MKIVWSVAVLFFSAAPLWAQAQPQQQAKPLSRAPATAPSAAQQAEAKPAEKIDPEKEAAINHLLELTGSKTMVHQAMSNMAMLMRSNLEKNLPKDEKSRQLLDLFFEKLTGKAADDFKALSAIFIPIYDKYYSKEDIQGMVQFYESPLGQKLLKVMPNLMREAQAASFQWGEKLGREAMEEVLKEHPELKPAEPATPEKK